MLRLLKYIKASLLVALLLGHVTFMAQVVTNDGLTLTIQAGLVVTVQGGYTNKTNAVTTTLGIIDNAGTITLTGDWTNNSANTVFSTNTGLVTILGTTAAQTIGGTNSTGFYNLTTNNTFGTSPQIILAVNQTVKNTLTMTAGNINLAGFTKTLGTSPASPGTLVHSTTSASGWMYGGNFARYYGTSTVADGAVAGLFPVGNAVGDFRPFYLTCPTTAPTTGGLHTVSHTNATTVSNVSFADGGSTVTRRHDALWTSSASGFVGGTYNTRGEGTSFGTIGAVADLRLTLVGSVVGTAGVNAGTTADPIVNRTGLTLAQLNNNFYIGSVNKINSPLPIELISFNATLNKQNTVDVVWETASELNNDYFTIEKTQDGVNFETVDVVDGAGNSTQNIRYSTIDTNPYKGLSYYRLTQTDFNKQLKRTPLVSIEYNKDEFSFSVYPNPSNGKDLKLNLTGFDKETLIVVVDVLGKEYYSKVILLEDEKNVYAIDKLENISPGIYWLVASSKQKLYSVKIIIQ